MKYPKIIMLLAILSLNLYGQYPVPPDPVTPSYFGFSGLMFIPTTQTQEVGDWNLAYKTRPGSGDELTLLPYSVSLVFAPFTEGLEVAITNTFIYASNKQFGGVPYKGSIDSTTTALPIIPSVKYRFMPMTSSNFHVSMAFGLAAPYGAYYVVDKFFSLYVFDATIHTGFATKLTTYHAFAGATFSFGSRLKPYRRDFPTQLFIEGAWGGSLNQLDEKEEAFISISIRQAWTANLFISAYHRIDQQPSLRDGRIIKDKPTKKMGVGLSLIL